MNGNQERWLQVSAGQGPAECAWAVVQVLGEVEREARAASLGCQVIAIEPGPEAGTAFSALVALSGSAGVDAFAESWAGTVQWVARSPFRPGHKRKNWFVGIEIFEPVDEAEFRVADVQWETMRASGPGGQHVNRTESAVRATHLPTGLQASAMEERSQHRNRKLALARLAKKLAARNNERRDEAKDARRQAHYQLERGNPVRVLRPRGE